MIHELKTLPKDFKLIKESNMICFEARKDDKFKTGDFIILEEYDPNNEWEDINDNLTHYSGEKIVKQISYILKDELSKDYVILGIKDIKEDIKLRWANF